ncbi:MAG TPA: hypothetical protein PKC43_09210 [Phycisphaerales bacterium]|nr:hypothetical protein [Phycisphaerales bacterium]HMP37613.1 hypothetical protein [Phycisphaerales bacterium]
MRTHCAAHDPSPSELRAIRRDRASATASTSLARGGPRSTPGHGIVFVFVAAAILGSAGGPAASILAQGTYPSAPPAPITWTCVANNSCTLMTIRCKGSNALYCLVGQPCTYCELGLSQTQCTAGGVGCLRANDDIPTFDCGWLMTGLCDGFECVGAMPSSTTRCKRIWCQQAVCP